MPKSLSDPSKSLHPSPTKDSKPYTTTTTNNDSPTKSAGNSGTSGSGSGWTDKQKLALFDAIYKKSDKISWDEVAGVVGKDKVACKNRYVRQLQEKLRKAIIEG